MGWTCASLKEECERGARGCVGCRHMNLGEGGVEWERGLDEAEAGKRRALSRSFDGRGLRATTEKKTSTSFEHHIWSLSLTFCQKKGFFVGVGIGACVRLCGYVVAYPEGTATS